MRKLDLLYATTSKFKKEEVDVICKHVSFRNETGDDEVIGERFHFEFSDVPTDEPLEVDLEAMVKHKAVSAYRSLLMPCIVEHAGIVLQDHIGSGFPGGLTQPMMDSLGAEGFLKRTSCSGEKAVAVAVIGYCDGTCVRTFKGETPGVMSDHPRGSRDFYWDTLFVPDGLSGHTYAEISGDPKRGVREKMTVSQSARAIRQFVEFLVRNSTTSLYNEFPSLS